jgi:hypothetical protein
MELARHTSAISSRKGAAVGVAGIARLVGGMQGEGGGGLAGLLGRDKMEALLPKLYRWVRV